MVPSHSIHCCCGSQADADDPDAAKDVVMPGQPGFRWHAMVPQAASLDYVRLPASQFAMPEKKQGGSKKDQGGLVQQHEGKKLCPCHGPV